MGKLDNPFVISGYEGAHFLTAGSSSALLYFLYRYIRYKIAI